MGITSKNGRSTIQLNQGKDAWEIVDHVDGTTDPISRKYLFSFVAELADKLLFEFTSEEEADILEWSAETIRLEIEDVFISRGFTWKEMERWTTDCYQISMSILDININPVSAIRTLLSKQKIPVRYDFSTGKEHPHPISVGLLCRREIRKGREWVTLTAYGTLEDLRQKLTKEERMLKAAGIR